MNGQPFPHNIETKNYIKKRDPKKPIIIGVASALAAAILGIGAYFIFKPHEHIFTDWVVTKAASCENAGTREHYCEDCGASEVISIPALGHEELAVPGYPPRVDADGLSDKIYCSVCNKVLQEHTVIKATGSQGLEYQIIFESDGTLGCSITGLGTCTDPHVIIPEYIDGCRVVAIGTSAFNANNDPRATSIMSITIPETVKTIGTYAFDGCTHLEKINIPEGVAEIRPYTFHGCERLKSISLPESVKAIGSHAFDGCTKLESVNIPTSIERIEEYTFYGCRALKSIEIPASVTSIGAYAFSDCRSATKIEIPEGVERIEMHAFSFCHAAEELYIPESVTFISDSAFSTIGAEYINIPDNVTYIGENVFAWSPNLKKVSLPASLEHISNWVFQDCELLTEIDFRGTLEEWEAVDVSPVWKNKEVHINCTDGVAEHINEIVYGYPATTEENGLTDGKQCSICGVVTEPQKIIHAGSQGLWYSVNNDGITCTVSHVNNCTDTKLVIPQYIDGYRVTAIGYGAFSGCTHITSVVVPEGVTVIGHSAFNGCTNLRIVVLPESVETIDNMAFSTCSSLASINLPRNLKAINAGAFAGCTSLSEIEIPAGVKSIGNEAFSGCTGLTSIIIADGVESIGSGAFSYCTGITEIIVPMSVTSIGGSAFSSCSALENAVIYANIDTLGNGAFISCENLLYVTLPNSVKTIESLSFAYCKKLSGINLPSGLETIESSAFYECHSLSEIEIPDSVTSIGEYAFGNCKALKSVKLSEGLTKIEANAFSYCNALDGTVAIPSKVVEIGENAFTGCGGVDEFFIPASVTKIGANAFGICYDASFRYDGTTEAWGAIDKPENWYTGMEYVHVYCDDGTLGHKEIVNKGYAESATHDGLTDGIYCGLCGEVLAVQTVIPATWQESQGLSYSVLYGTQCEITGRGTCMDIDILFPTHIDGYEVTSIGAGAFMNDTSLKYITLHQGISSISDNAFAGCSSLETAFLPEGVASIGSGAFQRCTKLETIVIPSSVVLVGSNAFSNCTSIDGVVIKDGVQLIGACAFENCTSLSSIYLPPSVSSVYGSTFIGCTSLSHISADSPYLKSYDGVLYSADGTKLICYPLAKQEETYTVREGTEVIGSDAFYGNKKVRYIILPDGLNEIGENAFNGCENLTGTKEGMRLVTIPDGVTKIGNNSFYGCDRLYKVQIPTSVTSIGISAFESCGTLEDIIYLGMYEELLAVPKGSYWASANSACTVYCNDAAIDYSGNVTKYSYGFDYTSDGAGYATITGIGTCTDTALVIPKYINGNQVGRIKEYSFKNNTEITSVVVPAGCSINEGAFNGCTSLTSATLPAMTYIYGATFYGCESLTEIYYIGNVEAWNAINKVESWDSFTGEYTIYCTNGEVYKNGEYIRFSEGLAYTVTANNTCKITGMGICMDTEIGIPQYIDGYKVTAIGQYAFMYNTSITSVKMLEGITKIELESFSGCDNLVSVVLPEGLISIGDYAFINCEKLRDINLPSTVEEIGLYCFDHCTSLKEIAIPEGVTEIDKNTFRGCTSLTKVTLPDGLESIGEYAFYECTSLKSIVIPESVTVIGYYAFSGCESLTSIVVPENVYQLMGGAFEWCTSLRTATVCGDTVGDSIFENCSALQSVTVTEGTRRLAGFYIFENCTSLTQITLPKSLVEINSYVFYHCENLRTINYNGTVAEWQALKKYTGWDDYTGDYTVYCTDGNITKAGKVTYK